MNLSLFNTENLFSAATDLFKQLGIQLNSNTAQPIPVQDILQSPYKDSDVFTSIAQAFFIGIIDDSVFQVTGMFDSKYSYKQAIAEADKHYEGLMLFALELKRQPTRTEISELTRAFNRVSQKMPVALVLKYTIAQEAVISLAMSERFKYMQNWRQGEKVGKVIILRDIHTKQTHTGHIRILQDLVKPTGISTYTELHRHWLNVLDVSVLNKKFFKDLSNWYFSAMNEVSFPPDVEKKKDIRNATNLIRLITRIIFIWFIREKQLVPARLFNKEFVKTILKEFDKNKKSHHYYNAIMQNLFFGTLNQKMKDRKFAQEGDSRENQKEYGVKNLFRYADLFTIPEKEVLMHFQDIPFLNGGLFDCLDKPNDDGTIVYVDGFSRNAKKQATIPDYLFFGEERDVDLNEVYGTTNKRYTTKGLINLLDSYKFTIAENTPLEEEIALDPELLGKVFENLLASYNPETQTTARKQTGSFYTPREIVDYMVDESLLEYIKQNVKNDSKDFETRLRDVFSYSENPNPFSVAETKDLIEAINNCKILDPACGSGAFPMGILHKMVHILQKLDPENKLWKNLQREKAIKETEEAFSIGNKEQRDKRLAEISDVFENNASDYGRKLYLIENCIYGIDIQPIAVQIAKLRFFISLVIDQKVNKTKENFGVRSLPNLETKFVAANTLIGLDKPVQGGFRNLALDAKENEIISLRHQYFTANTRKEKLALQNKDKTLRKDIAQLLRADGWHSKVAEQIAQFDPYNQNTSAMWFDAEWMFGLTNGFDVVIGNPPYIQLQKDEGKLAKEFATQGFLTFERTGDIYSLFYERGWQLLRQHGLLCYITSNKWMRAGYGESTRKFFAEKTNPLVLIDFAGQRIFESATVDVNILLFAKSTNESKTLACTIKEQMPENLSVFMRQSAHTMAFRNADSWVILSGIEQRIKEKIERAGTPLKDWDIQINYGIKTGYNEAFIIDGATKDKLIKEDPKSAEIIRPILRGRDIKRYGYEFADLWLIATFPSLKIDIEQYPAVKKHLLSFGMQRLEQTGKEYKIGGQTIKARKKTNNKWFETQDSISYWEDFSKQKILWAETMRIHKDNTANFPRFGFESNGEYVTDKTCFFATGNHLKFILAVLNSALGRYLCSQYVSILDDGGYLMQKLYLEKIPIASYSIKIEKLMKKAHSNKVEEYINRIVYQLYDLNEEEISFIESARNQPLHR